ncbi:MAG: alpha/beta fold hydrolase [Sphingorhabdus sp.]
MASFILIHGSWHGGWCFDAVRDILEDAGHEVIAPDLPGMGGDEAALRGVSLQGWADFAVGLCRGASQQPVVLAGHSRGGLVVSQAAETAPEAIDALVYICAMMLPDGMSRADFKTIEGPNPAFDAIISPVFGGAGTVVDPAGAPAVFAQLSPPDAVASAMTRLMTEPHGPRATPLKLTAEAYGSIPRTYIECTQDRTIPIESQRKMQSLVPGAVVVTLDADHSPYLSRPEELAAALIAAAATVGG